MGDVSTFIRLTIFLVLIQHVWSQNCSETQFVKDGQCYECGENSRLNGTACPCIATTIGETPFRRLEQYVNDYTKKCYNCSDTQFVKDGQCHECGENSNGDNSKLHGLSTKCLCTATTSDEPDFHRLKQYVNDYTKKCYRTPSEPRNITIASISNTTATLRWGPPKYSDRNLTTKYAIIIAECNNVCKRSNRILIGSNTQYTLTKLKPYTLYGFHLCTMKNDFYNNPSKEQSCTKDAEQFRTGEAAPGVIRTFSLHGSQSKHVFSFSAPTYFGSPLININIECEDAAKSRTQGSLLYNNVNTSLLYSLNVSKICGTGIRCSIYASNKYGKGTPTNKYFHVANDCNPDEPMKWGGIIAAVVIVPLFILIVAALYLWWWRRKQKKMEERWMGQLMHANRIFENSTHPFTPSNPYVDAFEIQQRIQESFRGDDSGDEEEIAYMTNDSHDFEFSREHLDVSKKLGEGNFAVVYRAEAYNIAGMSGKITVAVKVLKDDACDKDKDDFLQELELMKKIKPHINVVRLLGCCTGKGQNCMIVEFLPFGDLKDFLRRSRDSISLTEKDFFKYALDIASGMSHLADSNIVHRDLACRNVLMNARQRCKVADMGLARELNENGIHKREPAAKLPVKWMSPEFIMEGRASVKSDVWSFGIVLWEISTLGGQPYHGNKSIEVKGLLQKGYRMEQPVSCNDILYDIMTNCWNEDYKLRPTFDSLKETLENLMKKDENYMNFDSLPDDNPYFKFDNDEDDNVTIDGLEQDGAQYGGPMKNGGFEIDMNANGDVRYLRK